MVLSGWRGAQNSLAFGAGQPVFCDVCCLGQPERSEQDHMAAEMAQARTVLRVMAKQDRLLSAKPWADCDRREARHACYKAVISWQYGGALGAGNRVRLPRCVTHAIRKKYPNRNLTAIRARVTIGSRASVRATTQAFAPRMSRVPFARGAIFQWM